MGDVAGHVAVMKGSVCACCSSTVLLLACAAAAAHAHMPMPMPMLVNFWKSLLLAYRPRAATGCDVALDSRRHSSGTARKHALARPLKDEGYITLVCCLCCYACRVSSAYGNALQQRCNAYFCRLAQRARTCTLKSYQV
jgi:hypothetical protein